MTGPGPWLALEAPAKVNLHLAVGGRRADGFHEIETLFQAVELSDLVELQVVPGSEVHLDVRGADLGPVEENLATRAARAHAAATGSATGVHIRLTKRIPAGAGLGGGSSDAAAVLRLLDRIASRPLGAERLSALGATLGADVPFFLGDSTLAVGRGKGDVLESVPPLPVASIVLVLPPVHVATGPAYQALSRGRQGDPGPPVGVSVFSRPPRSWEDVRSLAHNDFQEVIARRHAEVGASLAALQEAGANPVLLSGSGGACFGLLPPDVDSVTVADRLHRSLGWRAVATRTLVCFPSPQERRITSEA